jgi:hypothetical protein
MIRAGSVFTRTKSAQPPISCRVIGIERRNYGSYECKWEISDRKHIDD